jgi:hypothetical protein
LTPERIQGAADAGELNTDEVQLLSGFLAEGCRGVCAEIDGKLVGYGFVQFEGEYQFGLSALKLEWFTLVDQGSLCSSSTMPSSIKCDATWYSIPVHTSLL